MRKGILICVATVACCGLVAATATAGKSKVSTQVTVANTGPGVYSGTVSANKGCHKNRDVSVWHDTNGNGVIDGEPTDFKIGETESDSKGDFVVEGNQAPQGDNIIVEVAKSKRGKKTRCKAGTGDATSTGGAT